MNIAQAKKAGAVAFQQGRSSAAAQNGAFCIEAAASDVKYVELLRAYLRGWTIAHLADKAPIPTMPSVIELANIMEAA